MKKKIAEIARREDIWFSCKCMYYKWHWQPSLEAIAVYHWTRSHNSNHRRVWHFLPSYYSLRIFFGSFTSFLSQYKQKKATANGAVAAVAEYYCIFSLFVCSKACDHVGGRIAVSFSQFFSNRVHVSTVQLAKCIDAGEFYSLKYVAKWRLLLIFIFHPS